MPGLQIQRAPEVNAKPIAKHNKNEDNKFTKKVKEVMVRDGRHWEVDQELMTDSYFDWGASGEEAGRVLAGEVEGVAVENLVSARQRPETAHRQSSPGQCRSLDVGGQFRVSYLDWTVSAERQSR